MAKEVNLFEAAAFSELTAAGLEVTKKERIAYDYTIKLDDITFDAEDLYTTLSEIISSDIVVMYSRAKIDVLKKYGILEYEGNSRWYSAARLGPNGKEFLRMLSEKID